MNRSKLACKAMFLAGAIGLSVALLATPRPANALIQTPLPQLLPIPAITPPPTPAPLAPPINPGYAPTGRRAVADPVPVRAPIRNAATHCPSLSGAAIARTH